MRRSHVLRVIDSDAEEGITSRASELPPEEIDDSLGGSIMPHRPWLFSAVAVCVFLLACSSAPTSSDSNKHFMDARTSLKSSDFDAALRNLDRAIKTAPDESERQQAVILRTALVTAEADAYRQMAEAYYMGANSRRLRDTRANFINSARTITAPAVLC
jgi:hypothetical protein